MFAQSGHFSNATVYRVPRNISLIFFAALDIKQATGQSKGKEAKLSATKRKEAKLSAIKRKEAKLSATKRKEAKLSATKRKEAKLSATTVLIFMEAK